MIELGNYKNGDWNVTIFSDGTKIRETDVDYPVSLFPDSIDVKITDYCDAGCRYCHENSTTKGRHGNLENVIKVYSLLPKGVEIAIGGGNPFSHPDLDILLKELTGMGIICNITINEKHFTSERNRIENLISKGYLKGVGYSYSSIPLNWDYEHSCTHIITGVSNYSELPRIIEHNNGKILLLGYKNFRRGIKYLNNNLLIVEANILSWYRNLHKVINQANIVSFDNLGIDQLNPKRLFIHRSQYNEFYMGDDGTHTMYMDAVNNEVALSSTSLNRLSIKDMDTLQLQNVIKYILTSKKEIK